MVLATYPVVTSYWGDAPIAPSTLTENVEADVVIIGGGLAGLSSAYYLKRARPDLQVVLVESRHVGFGASGRNFGSVPQLGRSDPDLIEDLLGVGEAQFVIDHQARMLTDFESLIEAESIACDYERSNVLLVARDDASASRVALLTEHHQRFKYPSQRLTADEVRACIGLDCVGGLSCGRQGFVDPLKLTRGLADAARSRGVDIREGTPVTGLARRGTGVVAHAAEGSVTADTCVIAANAFSPALGTGAGWFEPIYTYVLATAPLTATERAELGWDERWHRQAFDAGQIGVYYYMQLRPNGQFMMGGGVAPPSPDGRTLPAHDNVTVFQRIHAEMLLRYPVLESVEIASAWGGPLAMTATGLPTTAWVDESVIVNAGYNGRGALMATTSGMVIVNRVLGAEYTDSEYERYARDLLQERAAEVKVSWS